MKSALGIHSPSRVMRDQVGIWIPAGIAEGITQGADVAVDAVKDMTEAAVEAAEAGMGTLSAALTPGALSGSVPLGVRSSSLNRALSASAGSAPGAAASGGLHVHVNAADEMSPDRFGRRVGEAINHHLNLEGVLI